MARIDTLREPRRIGIIGGGPAGALSALQLRRLAVEAGRDLEVLIFERKQFGVSGPRGCNMCAGIVSSGLVRQLESVGVTVPPETVQRRIEAYTLEVLGARVRLEKPPGARIYTAFRSGGPMGEEFGTERSFDHLLLQAALHAGAGDVREVVKDVRLPRNRSEPVVLTDAEGQEYEVDAVVGAFGVNSRMGPAFEQLGFGYRTPRTTVAAQCEIRLAPEEIDARFGNEVRAFALGIPGLSFAAMIPKERHVTVSLIGAHVGPAQLEEFLQQPEARAYLPPDWELPARYCHCQPRLPVSAARNVVADRLVVVGDAHVSRFLKNGLDSALITASLAAEAIISGGVGRDNLLRRYVRPCRRIFTWDRRCARILLGVHELLARMPAVAGAHLRFAAREQQSPGPNPLSTVLWGMLTGDELCPALLRRALSPSLQARLAWEVTSALWRRGRASTSAPALEGRRPDHDADD